MRSWLCSLNNVSESFIGKKRNNKMSVIAGCSTGLGFKTQYGNCDLWMCRYDMRTIWISVLQFNFNVK
jgi:hypothetical protein